MIVNQAMRPIAEKFGKKYPFVKLTYWRADSEDIAQKIVGRGARQQRGGRRDRRHRRRRAGGRGRSRCCPITRRRSRPIREAYRDPDGLWTPTRLSYYSIAYNTRLVPADKVPKTYEDLLDPQWKGKMAWRIGSVERHAAVPHQSAPRLGRGEGAAYFEKLKDQKIVNFGAGSARTLVDRVIAGEYAIALNIFAHHPLISKAKGAPVNSQLHGSGRRRRPPPWAW